MKIRMMTGGSPIFWESPGKNSEPIGELLRLPQLAVHHGYVEPDMTEKRGRAHLKVGNVGKLLKRANFGLMSEDVLAGNPK